MMLPGLPFFKQFLLQHRFDTSLTMTQLSSIVKFQMTDNGPYMISPSATNPADGTGVNNDGSPAFPGQVFFNPGAGTLDVLQRRLFDGPWIFGLDMSALKTVKIRERQALEIRMDAFDAHDYGSRLLQFGAHYRF
jgi:hypothetical protein